MSELVSSTQPLDCVCGKSKPFVETGIDLSSVYSRESHERYGLLLCLECGVLKTDPFPTPQKLNEIYSNDYAYDYHDSVITEKSYRARSLLKILQSSFRCNSILELGSGSGVLLNEAAKLNMKFVGVELSGKAGNILPMNLKENLVIDSAENFLKACETISSTVILSHTLEHFRKPDEILRLIHDKMVKSNYIVIVVPNRKTIFGRNRNIFWGYWQVPVHTYHFEKSSLVSLLRSTGFIPKKISYRSGDFLSKGLFVLNLFALPSTSIPKKRILTLISILSFIWTAFYRFGRSDLIVVAER